MNFNSIRVRYTAAFCSIAAFFIILVFMNNSLISKTENGMNLFGLTFNPAISAVINADRDLYQARVAELQILASSNNREAANRFLEDYQENAQQAFDRMQKYKQLLSIYPDITSKLRGFETGFNNWKSLSTNVFTLAQNGQLAEAKALSDGDSKKAFSDLRDFYDIAGEAADNKSKKLSEDIQNEVSASQTVLTTISIVVILFTLIVGVTAPKAMADALNNLSTKLKGLNSGDGDLTRRINSSRKDEIGQVADDFDELINGLAELIKSIVDQSGELILGVDGLDNGAQNIQRTSEQQTESVQLIATAVNEMSYAIKEVAENAQLTANEVQEVNQLTQAGSRITSNAVEEINSLSVTVENAANVILKLSENSANIASVLDVIRGIAEQTNLLALNAAIEAARAGEQGRGFAVVADEVRSLASKTQDSTENIQKMIESLQNGVKEAVDSINKGNEATKSTVELSQQTLDALDKIASASSRVSDAASQTATATEEQSQVAQDVSKNLTVLSDHTNSNFQVAEQNGEQATNTMGLATALSDSVTRFKLD